MLCNILLAGNVFSQAMPDTAHFTFDSLTNKITANQTGYNTLSVRAKLTWDDGSSEQVFQANIRMQKDSLVWMSLTGALGVEGARLLITPDSVRMINKLAGEYVVRDFDFMRSWFLFPISFKMLEQIIAGEKIDIQEKVSKAIYEGGQFVVYYENDKLIEKIWVNTENYTLAKVMLKDKLLTQDMTITFDAYKGLLDNGVDKPFSHFRSMVVNRDGVTLKLDMDINKVRLNEELSYPFEVSEKYKR